MRSIKMKDAIQVWHDNTDVASADHPDETTLYRMSLPNGLADAAQADIDHLAGCPACMEKWELLTLVMDDAGQTGLQSVSGEVPEAETPETPQTETETVPGLPGQPGVPPHDDIDDLSDTDQIVYSYGFLKAAATAFSEPVFLNSHCRRFVLGIFTDPERPDSGMITLDVTDAAVSGEGIDSLEDRLALVKDASGQTALKARIHHGRAAARIDDINQYDFSTWTLTVSPSKAGS